VKDEEEKKCPVPGDFKYRRTSLKGRAAVLDVADKIAD